MRKLVMSGVMLLVMLSCSCVSMDTTMMYLVNRKHDEAAVATKNLDVTYNHDVVGEWKYGPQFMPLSNIPNELMCFSLETWLERAKPNLKKASREYRDRND